MPMGPFELIDMVGLDVTLDVSKTMIQEIRKLFKNNRNKTALISIARISKSKYVVNPTVVLLNRQLRDVKQVK